MIYAAAHNGTNLAPFLQEMNAGLSNTQADSCEEDTCVDNGIQQLAQMMEQAKDIVFFGGAGVSTEIVP